MKTYHRIRWFLKEAVPIFLLAAVALFVLDKTGVLNAMKVFFMPVASEWLGLPRDIVDVLLLCVARHEAAAGLLLQQVDAGALNTVQTIVSVILITMFIPCFAHVVAIAKMMSVKTAGLMIPSIMISALLLAGILNHILKALIGA